MIECILFDMDGTLVDSEPLCVQAYIDLIPELDSTVEKLLPSFQGREFAVNLKKIETKTGRRLPSDFEQTYRAHVADLFESDLHAFDGVAAALSDISTPMCIASSGPQAKIKNALRITGLGKFFGDNIFSAYDIGCWKPDPGLFLHAAKQMGYLPENCLVVEDSQVGVAAGKAAEMVVLQFLPDGSTSKLANTFTSFSALPSLLKSYSGS